MAETTWTAGPWRADEGIAAGLDGARFPTTANVLVYADNDCDIHPIADCSANHTCRMDYDCEANARLIAAAPELYEALEGALYESDLVSRIETVFEPHPWIAQARAALAKARGE